MIIVDVDRLSAPTRTQLGEKLREEEDIVAWIVCGLRTLGWAAAEKW